MVLTRYRFKEKYHNWNLWQGYTLLGKPLNDFVGNMSLNLKQPPDIYPKTATGGLCTSLDELKDDVIDGMTKTLGSLEGKITGGSTPPIHASKEIRGSSPAHRRLKAVAPHRKG